MAVRANPNRMELLRLRRRLAIARRGHRLLKDKQEELVRRLLGLAADIRRQRLEVEAAAVAGERSLMAALGLMAGPEAWAFVAGSAPKVSIETGETTVLNFRGPKFSVTREASSADPTAGPPELDRILEERGALLEAIVELAERERWVGILARELIKTRRRVNALEHIVIPELAAAIRGITMKLAEQERGTIVRLMKIKEILEAGEESRA
jgi:V/A-type H+-transporting ATPase subunit D